MISPIAKALIGIAALAATAGPGFAQTIQSYVYDGTGRLVRATTTAGGVGAQTSYGFDDADNRISRTTTSGAFAALAPTRVGAPAGQSPETTASTAARAPFQAGRARLAP